jgi:hypothetical protein
MILGLLVLAAMFILPRPIDAATYSQDAMIDLTGQTYVTVRAVAVGDTDHDGNNELVANYDWYIGSGVPSLVFFEWDGVQYVQEKAITDVSLVQRGLSLGSCSHIAIADVDMDGDTEITFAARIGAATGIHVLSWTGAAYSEIGYVGGTFYDVAVADGDNDGTNEIYAVESSGIDVLRWDGTGFPSVASWTVSGLAFVTIANADADSGLEIVLATGDLDVQTYQWNGADYVFEGAGSVSYGYIAEGLGVGDVDSDGLAEVVRMDYHLNIVVYGWNGNSFDVEWNGISTPDPSDTIHHGHVGDVDDDGVPEILVGHGNHVGADSLFVYKYVGGNYVADWNSGWLDGYVHVVETGDADNDGLTEMVTGSGALSRVRVFSSDMPVDRRPIAVAKASTSSVSMGEIVTFDATSSTDDVGITAYLWDFGDGAVDANPVVTHAYASRGTYLVTLEVWDTAGQNDTDTVAISVVNRPPITNAGPDKTVLKKTVVFLDGGGSSDPDGDSMTFTWSQTGGVQVTLVDPHSSNTSFIPPLSGAYMFRLVVTDTFSGMSADSVVITATNRPPIILSVNPMERSVTVDSGTRQTLSIVAVDPDSDLLTYTWRVGGVLSGNNSPSYELEASGGTYVINVTISDGEAEIWHEWSISTSAPPGVLLSPLVWLTVIIILVAIIIVALIVAIRRRRRRKEPALDS